MFTQIDKLKSYGIINIPNNIRNLIPFKCYYCKNEFMVSVKTLLKKEEKVCCRKCRYSTIEFKTKMANLVHNRWDNDIYVHDVMLRRTLEHKRLSSDIAKKLWKDPVYKKHVIESVNHEKLSSSSRKAALARRDEISKSTKRNWDNPDYRNLLTNQAKSRWKDQEYITKTKNGITQEARQKISESAKRSWQREEYKKQRAYYNSLIPKVSSLQTILYSILDDMGIKYYREYNDRASDPECVIGPYSFDCVIPRNGRPTLLIECQGEYWHSLSDNVRRDAAKSSYIINNFPDQYELRYLWEHEFQNQNKVLQTLQFWLGEKLQPINFNLSSVQVRKCLPSDYKLFLSKYHYIVNHTWGITYGAFLENILIAICIFTKIKQDTKELSHLCIHPSYYNNNFGSWFINHCIELLPLEINAVISYYDSTISYNYEIYETCKFIKSEIINPDYWYIDNVGWVMHKKTFRERAVAVRMTEDDYAMKHKYKKILGHEKIKLVFNR